MVDLIVDKDEDEGWRRPSAFIAVNPTAYVPSVVSPNDVVLDHHRGVIAVDPTAQSQHLI